MAISNIFKYGTVIDVKDEFDGDRVRVYIKGLDPVDFSIEDIPFAFPLLPKNLYIKPKVGESVFVFFQGESKLDDRFFIGPIISQPHRLDNDSLTGQAFLSSGLIKPDIAPSLKPENTGVQFENNDVGLQGRGSTDIVVKPNEIRIRAGKTLDMRTFNIENPTYIQTKFDTSENTGHINIVSDYINLLSHKGIDKFNLSDQNDLINSEEYDKILKKAHQLPFGDILIDFMNIFVRAFATHVHAYAGLPPDLNQIELKTLLEFQTDKILSKNVRIN
jgi:hypothetical protein